MEGDGLIELLLRRAHLHGDGQGLDDLRRVEATMWAPRIH
jgi:hypothetical protein